MDHSPIESKVEKDLTFPEAIKEVISGRRITRREWEDVKIYGFLNKDILSLHKIDDKNYQWILNDGDLFANDWIVI